MNALHQWLLRHRTTWPAWLGTALLLIAAVLWVFGLAPLRSENEVLQQAILNAPPRLRTATLLTDGPLGQLKQYEAHLAHGDAALEWVTRIYMTGTANGLALNAGEYRLERTPDDRLLRYRINLPVMGSYGQLRAFVLQVLRDIPSATLDGIQLRHDAVGTSIEARIRFSLYLLPV